MSKTKRYATGSIVLIPFPFTKLKSEKIRPALIISQSLEEVNVLFISSKQKSQKNSIKIKSNKDNGLKKDSTVVCTKIATLDKKIVLGRIGNFSKSDFIKIKKALKTYLNL
jgi:mRNA interferase MazF